MWLYQLDVWKYIQGKIYNKPLFEVDFFGKKYWGIIKEHKKFGLSLRWFQILGVELPENYEDKFKDELNIVKKQLKSKFGDIFLQLGVINLLDEPFFENRKKIESNLKKFGLNVSIRENMPLATVVVDIDKSEEELLKGFSKSAKRHLNKAKKENLEFKKADKSEFDEFYNLWQDISQKKGFHIYPKKEYLNLLDYLYSSNQGALFVVKKDEKIVSGSIQINYQDWSYYLYGASSRQASKFGVHYFLKYEMFKYLKTKGIKKVDLLGVAPEGVENHHLKGVSQFKHSLGGQHIEYWGNYDLPLNNLAYKLLFLRKSLRG